MPLFIGRVDPMRLCVLRSTEQVSMPQEEQRFELASSTSARRKPGLDSEQAADARKSNPRQPQKILWSQPNKTIGRERPLRNR